MPMLEQAADLVNGTGIFAVGRHRCMATRLFGSSYNVLVDC